MDKEEGMRKEEDKLHHRKIPLLELLPMILVIMMMY
jgi:hypothetical protein